MSRNAASSGEPSSALMALKLPAAPTTATAWEGMPRRASRVAATPSPPPRAMSGAPMTAAKTSSVA